MPSAVRLRALLALAVLTTSAAAAAAPGQGADVPDDDEGRRIHSGFYARAALGPGAVTVDRALGGGATPDGPLGATVGGAGCAGELTLGGTPLPGLVTGGTVLLLLVPRASFTDTGTTLQDHGGLRLGLVGPTVDFFPKPRGGFHFLGTVGLAMLTRDGSGPLGRGFDGRGGALSFGVGYDAWVARDWSVGLLARVTGAIVQDRGPDRGYLREPDRLLLGTLAATVLFQ